jgi:hypothetical protein
MRFVHWRGVGLASALMAAIVVGLVSSPRAQAGGWYHWWNGHTINGRWVSAIDYRTGGPYYAPPIPYGEYTKNYTACIHEGAGAALGLLGKVCGHCKGAGCKMCGFLGCLHGLGCHNCGGAGCGSCGGDGVVDGSLCGNCNGRGCGNCGGHGLIACEGQGLGLHSGAGNGLGDPTCGLCGWGKAGHSHGAVATVAAGTLASAQSMPSAQAGRACSLCGGRGRIGTGICGACGGQGRIYGMVSGVKCGLCGGSGRNGAGLCGDCGGAGLLSGLKCGSCGGAGVIDGQACGTCGGRGLLACVHDGDGHLAGAAHHVLGSAASAAHHVAGTASGLAHQAMWKAGIGGVEYFVGPGGPVPITPGYVNYVVATRSPRDFFAFPPMVDQAFNSTSYRAPLYQEPSRPGTVVAPAPINQVRQAAPFPAGGNVNVPPPVPGANNPNVPPPPPPGDDEDDPMNR